MKFVNLFVEAAFQPRKIDSREIASALEEFGKVVSYRGGEIEAQYNRMNDKLIESRHRRSGQIHQKKKVIVLKAASRCNFVFCESGNA